ncbi:hypothetical protein VB618_00130 [Microvirga sp. CF3062]|uniref:hypothetical protein n=1 Tax=Microvirga sp. CF3062 TaxID=3110182 RepID=UPI002E7744AB|nr:hypothetical protein [Microvirga sp. CF3062]MEE1654585.1 hypothetical protein [Microvirga sp. CF3062]
MTKLKRLSAVLAGCILAGSLATGVSAQPRVDRDWDETREWRDRPQEWRPDRGYRDRDRGWERDRRWRERDCYYETRRERNRYGESIVRRYRVCDD